MLIWVVLVGVALVLWLLLDIRRALGLRIRPSLPGSPKATTYRTGFPGAVPPNRFVVVRWPDGVHVYQGCIGADARKVYEHTHRSG